MKTILFLEDDPDQSDTICKILGAEFTDCRIVSCDTESDLYNAVESLQIGDLYFAVLDAMVPWCFPAEDMPIPPIDVQAGGIRYAGTRCLRAIREKFGSEVPIWIYSILSTEGHGVAAGPNTFIIEKQPNNGELLEAIRAAI